MARSLTINCDSKIEFNDKGTENTPFEIIVTVDGQKDNASFTVTTVLGDWFSYTIERMEDASFSHTGGYVKIILRVDKNLSTEDRYGLIEIEHNCANIIKSVEIKQDGVKYELTSVYENGWQFMSIPEKLYEEKSVKLKASNGRAKWYVKEIQQYQVIKGDEFDDVTDEYKGQESQDNSMRQVRVPYDGVFNYRIEEAKEDEKEDRLIVKSFGQIDLITKKNDVDGHPHMRYFFVLSHIDVNNSNKMALDEKGIKYSDRKLFIFDGDEGKGEEYGEGDEIIVVPSEKDSYNFLVNNSKSPIINIPFGGQDNIGVVVISTKNGNSLNYSASLDSGINWCTINSDGTSISVTENTNGYRNCVISYTQSETNEVIKLKISQDASIEEFIFKVNEKTNNFTVPQFDITGHTYSTTVISKKGNTDIPYTVYQQSKASWSKYENGVITIDENQSTTERSVVYVFRQEGGSTKPPIYVTISQKANDETWVFEATPSTKNASSDGETVNLTIVSQHNGTFVGFSAIVDENVDWLYYDTQNKAIVVSPYTYDLEGDTRSTTITFKQMESNATQTVQITQKKMESMAVLVFDDNGTEKTQLTLEVGEFEETKTVRIKSTTSDDYPDSNIRTIGTPSEWIKLSNVNGDGYKYYTIDVTSKTNTSTERQESITFTNESDKTIVLTIKQSAKTVKKNNIIFQAGPDVNANNKFELYIVYLTGGKPDMNNKVGEFIFDENTDSMTIELEEGKDFFLAYKSGEGEDELTITQQKGGSTNTLTRTEGESYVSVNNVDGEIITINAESVEYVYEFEEDKITVGWEGKFYNEPFGKLYSYSISDTTKTAVPITNVTIKDGDFITNTNYEGPFTDSDDNSPYYKITVGVETNINEQPRTGHLTVTNERGEEIVLEVEQVKNGDIILTEFDYIVMNYTWTDYTNSKYVYSRDFDCVMFFNTASIGAMYKKYSSFSSNLILENGTVYAELAYDQIKSPSLSDLNRIETQVVYLAKLKEDGYLKKIKNSGDRTLKIELYGNLFNTGYAEMTPVNLRTVDLTIHTYLGGTMIRDDAKQTMQNVGGEEKSHQKIQTYYLRSINMISGISDSNVASFDHLGTLNYNVQDQTAVFSPNSELFNPLTENNK